MESPKLESIELKINIRFVINLVSFTQSHFIKDNSQIVFTLGFKQKQFIYFSIDNFHKPVPEDDVWSAIKVVVTISLVFGT